jgi:UDP-N-acetylglucosamine--N-acetylmuramyl-(pentapeptide) pyrophosphoryl-undecaprenol N-acetylglucosamine transferase
MFCGGGTGGHLFPGIAIAMALRKRSPECAILFVGTRRGLEETTLPRYGFDFRPVKSAGFKNLGLLKKLKALIILPAGILEGLYLIKSFKPQVIIGLGGYSALPVMIAAVFKRIYRAIQEQNSLPGLTNRLLAPFVHRIFTSFEETLSVFPEGKTRVTGNPVREGLCAGRQIINSDFGDTLLVLGGSLGAHFINNRCIVCLPALLKKFPSLTLHLQTGRKDYAVVSETFKPFGTRVRVSAFIENMNQAYRKATLVVARAGATTLAELAVCGIPAILIPFPYAANDHQTLNARVFSNKNAAILLPQSRATDARFEETIAGLLEDRKKRRTMAENMRAAGRSEAADVIAEVLFNLPPLREVSWS